MCQTVSVTLGLIFVLVLPKVPLYGLLFLIYINDLSDEPKSECQLFADCTSLFSVVHNVNISKSDLKSDLLKIYEWAYQWKMKFNPDASKQAPETVFSRKVLKPFRPYVHLAIIQSNQHQFKNILG